MSTVSWILVKYGTFLRKDSRVQLQAKWIGASPSHLKGSLLKLPTLMQIKAVFLPQNSVYHAISRGPNESDFRSNHRHFSGVVPKRRR